MLIKGRDLPEFTEAYQKARKMYVLFSGLLLSWELVGFDIEKLDTAAGKITIKTPDAIPFVFLALIIYFGSRLFLEWRLMPQHVRSLLIPKIDFYISNSISVAAITVYGIQLIIKKQIYDPDVFLYLILFAILISYLRMFYLSSRIKKSGLTVHSKFVIYILRYALGFLFVIYVSGVLFKNGEYFNFTLSLVLALYALLLVFTFYIGYRFKKIKMDLEVLGYD